MQRRHDNRKGKLCAPRCVNCKHVAGTAACQNVIDGRVLPLSAGAGTGKVIALLGSALWHHVEGVWEPWGQWKYTACTVGSSKSQCLDWTGVRAPPGRKCALIRWSSHYWSETVNSQEHLCCCFVLPCGNVKIQTRWLKHIRTIRDVELINTWSYPTCLSTMDSCHVAIMVCDVFLLLYRDKWSIRRPAVPWTSSTTCTVTVACFGFDSPKMLPA